MSTNRSIFQASPFRPAYGLQPVRYGMGAIQTVRMGDWLDDLTGGSTDAILAELDSWIVKLPVGAAGDYTKKRDECMAKSTISQYKCLYDLFQEIKRDYKDDGSPTAAPPVVPPTPKPAASGLPILPIAIGAVGLAGLLYFVLGKN